MEPEECQHKTDTHPHTTADGRVIPMTSCRRCGMEWTPKEAQ